MTKEASDSDFYDFIKKKLDGMHHKPNAQWLLVSLYCSSFNSFSNIFEMQKLRGLWQFESLIEERPIASSQTSGCQEGHEQTHQTSLEKCKKAP